MAAEMHERLTRLPRPETTIIMDRVLERARQLHEWGTPSILDACIAVAAADSAQGSRLAAFLRDRPGRPKSNPALCQRSVISFGRKRC